MDRLSDSSSALIQALDDAEAALQRGDAAGARVLLSGLEPRLLAAGLSKLVPRFFRLASDCERLAGNISEAMRLCSKGLARVDDPKDEERQRLIALGRRIIEDSDAK